MSALTPDLIKLQQWMEEYLLDQRLKQGEPDIPNDVAVGEVQEEPGLTSGQFRLWPAVGSEPPFYAIIWQEGYGSWWAIPFAPYAVPAMPEELRVRDDPPVRVLQGWNARRVSAGELRETWCLGQLDEERRFVFERWWLQIQSGATGGGGYEDLIGPPLRHPMDPRFAYLEEERLRADMFLGEQKVVQENPNQMAAEDADEDEEYRP